MKHFLHISFNWKGKAPIPKDINNAMDQAGDWLRYDDNCWIVYTEHDANAWYKYLERFLSDRVNQHLFICKLDPSMKQGWLPQWAWDWFKQRQA